MRPNQAIPSERFRRGRKLAAFTALLLVAALLSAGCGGDGTVAPNQPPGAALGDTPIVISGGSIHLDLNNSTFRPCNASSTPACAPAAGHTMYSAAGKISSGYYYDDNNGGPDTEYPISMTTPNIKIRIVGKDGGEEGTITIENDRTNNRVLVQLEEAKFKRRRTGSSRLISKKFRIEHFYVTDGTVPEKDYTAPGNNWPSNNKVTVELLGTP
jgi:hypothetical protein